MRVVVKFLRRSTVCLGALHDRLLRTFADCGVGFHASVIVHLNDVVYIFIRKWRVQKKIVVYLEACSKLSSTT